ncbi:HD domain-containing protein [Streptomyces sp. 71268]|uniref:HD domain-containing protein n=1 Tax=Streptomyces sp. 71268 TaxID=3002640 RepID=UPI0023F7000B|nr:HD domain-containing protein [Streptomyces sp. 71268]WEV24990.1 HD domain-containing protein [Streptomyces sp. 71268]
MSAEATNPAEQGSFGRRRGRPLIDLRNLRRFGRAALLGPAPRGRVPDAIEHVAKAHRAHHPGADLDVLRRAYELAESSHRGQMRKSGEPYITHPLAVTLILAELGAETTTLTASLLHDTVEDTEVTLDQVREEFGEEVRYLVDGVTKLEKVDYGAAAEPETFRKMLVATGNDVRVMSIKLADRLHNMRTLGVMRPEKQARIAKVTRDVLIPLAERLGVQALKTELEDLVFAILHPDEYAGTRDLIAEHATRPDPLAETARAVRAVLNDAGIAAEVLVRPRHIVSVYRVRRKRGELSGADLGRLLVLVGEDADCYAVLGELHTCFTPVISEFKDFIAVPKFNLYQSLHTAVAGEGGKVIEVLIRTQQMHKVAEAGVVALGNPYAATADGAEVAEPGAVQAADGAGGAGVTGGPGEGVDGERVDPTRPGWLSRLLDWQRAVSDTDAFWSSLRDDLAQDREITVFAADGTVLSVPDGASCVDAVYARYGAVGHSCVGARVNGRLVTLSTMLHDGDSVQFLMATGRDAASSGPSPEWLAHARTPAARIAITHWLAAHAAPSDRPTGPAPATEPDLAPHPAHGAAGPVSDASDADSAQANARRPRATVPGAGEPAVAGRETTEQATADHGPGGGPVTDAAQRSHIQPAPVHATAKDGATGHGARGASDDTGHGARGTEPGARSASDDMAHGARGAEPGAPGRVAAIRAAQADQPAPGAPPGSTDGVPGTASGAPASAEARARGTDLVPPSAARAEESPGSVTGDGTAPGGGSRSVPGAEGPPGRHAAATDTTTSRAPVTPTATPVTPAPSLSGTPLHATKPLADAPVTLEQAGAGAVQPDTRGDDRKTAAARPAPEAQRFATAPHGAGTADPAADADARDEADAPAETETETETDIDADTDTDATVRTVASPARAAADAPPGTPPGRRRSVGVVVDQPGVTVRLAGCCTPVPPDEVTGFAVRGRAVTVHRVPCPAVARMTEAGRQPVAVRWQTDADAAPVGYRVTLCAEAFSRPHLLADLTEVIAAQGAEVISAAVEPPYEQRVRHTYTLQLPDAGRLPVLMRAMRQVPSVYDVVRAGHELAAAGL